MRTDPTHHHLLLSPDIYFHIVINLQDSNLASKATKITKIYEYLEKCCLNQNLSNQNE